MKETTFENAKVGDVVYYGEERGEITTVMDSHTIPNPYPYPIIVKFKDTHLRFNPRGELHRDTRAQVLFWQPVDLAALAPEKPQEFVKKYQWVVKRKRYGYTDSFYYFVPPGYFLDIEDYSQYRIRVGGNLEAIKSDEFILRIDDSEVEMGKDENQGSPH